MKVDFAGRIGNVTLPYSKALLPLFEAVVNSIHAIEDTRDPKGAIRIHIKRKEGQMRQPLLTGGGYEARTITGFIVEDNGIGFTEENFNSFDTSDSTLKKSRGAKGVGRFMWAKAFDDVHIWSVFGTNGTRQVRKFKFSLQQDGIYNHTIEPGDQHERKTRIELVGYKDAYEKECPRKADTIAAKIVEHCLVSFLGSSCPTIELRDDDEPELINLNDKFAETIKPNARTETFKIGDYHFDIKHLRLYTGENVQHTIHFCAHDRDVMHVSVHTHIPYLRHKLKDENEKPYVYYAYVSGKLLNDRVNAERTGFHLSKDAEDRSLVDLSEPQLVKATLDSIRRELEPQLDTLKDQVRSKVRMLVEQKYPEYRKLLTVIDDYIDELSESIIGDPSELVFKLNEIQLREDLKAREALQAMLKEAPANISQEKEYQRRQKQYLSTISDIGQTRLAQYVIHRKIILELLQKRLQWNEQGEYSKEEAIHEVIFPMKDHSQGPAWERQNLWIIDEKLVFHRFLASDLPLKAIGPDSLDRPDLLVFNKPGAFSETEDGLIGSVVIVEFKRPAREGYRREDSPIDQVLNYIRKLNGKEVKDALGRTIQVAAGTAFYCYIVCDIKDKVQTFAENSGYRLTPDQMGYFGFNPVLNAYIEIISFDKLLLDAEKRNRVLFKNLQLID